jgi:hypothetical protein
VYTLAIVMGATVMAIGAGHLIASSLQLLELQCEVNERLPHPDKFEPQFWSLPQLTQLRRLQQNLLPHSLRPAKAIRFGVIGAAMLFFGAALLLLGLRGT